MIYIFKKLINNKGYFAKIEFEYNLITDDDYRSIEIDYQADEMWKATCIAGLHIFFDYYIRKRKGGLKIKILNVHWMPVDTNYIIILFTTILAFSEALNVEIKNLRLDENESLVLPDPRNI